MKIRHFALAAALILGAMTGAESAPRENWPKDNWIGAWGFVPIPLPPGVTPTPTPPATLADAPLANPPPAAMPPAPGPLLLDNPGNLPVVTADSDPVNVTIRQLVRMSAAGNRIRLRLS